MMNVPFAREDAQEAAAVGERDADRVIEEQLDARVERLVPKRNEVLFLLETDDGFAHVAERIALIVRHHYERVAFLIPSEAMSAGTILVMSGDSIHMDYASMLGPIDPQVRRARGGFVPALGYLEQFDRLIDKAAEGELSGAELTYMVESFDPAEMYRYEQETELSVALLEEWLAKYKFKNWQRTESGGRTVTAQMRRERAKEIAEALNDTKRWHSHSRGIPMAVLRRDLKLLIDDFGADPALGPAVHGYYRLLEDYSLKRGHMDYVLHTKERYVGQ